ncbi:MAG: hypothetical protein JWM80_3182 [Cyanobacteria bacterium RYN_339]|nr:hypothetical protein [Cyanobacteria bacterium RYN_339]
MEEPWSEPAQPAAPTDRLGALRRSITGKLNEATAKLAEAKGLDYQGAIGQHLEVMKQELGAVKQDLGQSGLGLVAKGLARGIQGDQPPPPAPEPTEDPLAFSRQAFLDELALVEHEEKTASRKRMAFIVAYVREPGSNPLFADRTLMYKILTAERAYQHKLLGETNQALAKLPPPPSQFGISAEEALADERLLAQEELRATWKKQVKQATTLQAQMFKLLQQLTGVTNAEAGEGFVPDAAVPTVTEKSSINEALDVASQLLAQRRKKTP